MLKSDLFLPVLVAGHVHVTHDHLVATFLDGEPAGDVVCLTCLSNVYRKLVKLSDFSVDICIARLSVVLS
jgi:hypothetical protein